MPTIVFIPVKFTSFKNCKCTVCGGRMRRQKTFEQTINPFNKLPNGELKTEIDIRKELQLRADAWRTQSETHEKCKP